MGSAKCIVDEDVSKLGELVSESIFFLFGGLDLLAFFVQPGAFLFLMESKVFEEDDGSFGWVTTGF